MASRCSPTLEASLRPSASFFSDEGAQSDGGLCQACWGFLCSCCPRRSPIGHSGSWSGARWSSKDSFWGWRPRRGEIRFSRGVSRERMSTIGFGGWASVHWPSFCGIVLGSSPRTGPGPDARAYFRLLDMSDLTTLWELHRDTDWPRFASPYQGELMTLDTVISGCVTFHLESPDGLDPQRRVILDNCLQELTSILPEIPDDARPYFGRLQTLAWTLRDAQRE